MADPTFERAARQFKIAFFSFYMQKYTERTENERRRETTKEKINENYLM